MAGFSRKVDRPFRMGTGSHCLRDTGNAALNPSYICNSFDIGGWTPLAQSEPPNDKGGSFVSQLGLFAIEKPHAEWSGCGFCCSYAVISNIPPPPHQAAGQYGGTPGSNPMSWRLIAHPIDSYALRASSILLSGLTSIHLDLFPPWPLTYFLRFTGLFGREYSFRLPITPFYWM